MRALAVVATAVTAFALTGAGAMPASAASPSKKAAQQGARWLSDQIIANGGFIKSFGVADPTNTAYAVIGLHAAKVGPTASSQAITYLQGQLGAALQSGGSDDAGALGYYILAAASAGADPHHFGGSGASNDLVARLIATQRTSGSDTGLFGAQDPSFDGAFREGVALAALKAAKVKGSDPAVKRAETWLESQQCTNGAWEAYRANTATACDPADPDTFSGPDTNSTAMAVQGLAAYGQRPNSAQTLNVLAATQSADGGWPYIAAGGQDSDPDSTALVIQAILADKSKPTAARWVHGSATPLNALTSYQLGCSAPAADRGAFFFPGSSDPSVLATVQAVPAEAGKKLPVAKSTTLKNVSATSCPS
jgi:hypothetical protein